MNVSYLRYSSKVKIPQPRSHEEDFAQKVTALKKSFDDVYEVHLCQETEKKVVDNTWVIYIEELPLQRAASAYRICSRLRILHDVGWSHLEIGHRRGHRLKREKTERRRTRFA
jgi:hypothetical protein